VSCPIGFVSDHLEVLFDIDIEAQGVARDVGLTSCENGVTPTGRAHFTALLRGRAGSRLVSRESMVVVGGGIRELSAGGSSPRRRRTECQPRRESSYRRRAVVGGSLATTHFAGRTIDGGRRFSLDAEAVRSRSRTCCDDQLESIDAMARRLAARRTMNCPRTRAGYPFISR